MEDDPGLALRAHGRPRRPGPGLASRGFHDLSTKALFPSWGSTWHKEGIRKAFHAYNDKVKATVPPENLLVFEAKDGYEPLCRFFGVPVPPTPYPHVNDTAEFQHHVEGINRVGFLIGIAGLGIPFLTVAPLHPTAIEELAVMEKDKADKEKAAAAEQMPAPAEVK